MSNKEICIVILNWNKAKDLINLIKSLEQCVALFAAKHKIYPKVVVVDNHSSDNSVEMVKSHFPYIHIIVTESNLGGSGGFNVGLRYSLEEGYRYTWLLDNDAIINGDALSPLYESIRKNKNIAIAGSKILHKDCPEIISESGANIRRLTTFPTPVNKNKINTLIHKEIITVDYVAACSLLARMDAVNNVGLMKEDFFLMWDDMEWGVRFNRNGYKVVAVTKSEVIHPGFSERIPSHQLIYYSWRNHLFFNSQHPNPFTRHAQVLYINAILSKNIVKHEINGRQDIAATLRRARLDFWEGRMGKFQQYSATKGKQGEPLNDLLLLHKKQRKYFIIHNSFPIGILREIINSLESVGAKYEILTNQDRADIVSNALPKVNFKYYSIATALAFSIRKNTVLIYPSWISMKFPYIARNKYVIFVNEDLSCVSTKITIGNQAAIFLRKMVLLPLAFFYGLLGPRPYKKL